jgi:hypothetical protein
LLFVAASRWENTRSTTTLICIRTLKAYQVLLRLRIVFLCNLRQLIASEGVHYLHAPHSSRGPPRGYQQRLPSPLGPRSRQGLPSLDIYINIRCIFALIQGFPFLSRKLIMQRILSRKLHSRSNWSLEVLPDRFLCGFCDGFIAVRPLL